MNQKRVKEGCFGPGRKVNKLSNELCISRKNIKFITQLKLFERIVKIDPFFEKYFIL